MRVLLQSNGFPKVVSALHITSTSLQAQERKSMLGDLWLEFCAKRGVGSAQSYRPGAPTSDAETEFIFECITRYFAELP